MIDKRKLRSKLRKYPVDQREEKLLAAMASVGNEIEEQNSRLRILQELYHEEYK